MAGFHGGEYDVSIVVPCFNEEHNVYHLYEGLRDVLDGMSLSYEIIYVDDGSRDNTFDILSKLNEEDHRVKIIRFRRNFGQTPALAAGFDYARGNVIVAIDGDLQYQPKDIPKLLEKINEGFDIASGWRTNRKSDGFFTRRLPSLIANRLMAYLSGTKLHDFGSTFKAYRSDVASEIKLYGEMHRFVPALAGAIGAKIAEVPVELQPRERGKSKYGLSRTWRVLMDIIAIKFFITYSKQPLRLFGVMGMFMSGAGVLIMIALTILKLFFNEPFAEHQPLLLLSILLLLVGVQFVSLGFIADLVTRTYYESQSKPIYNVRETLGNALPKSTKHLVD
jgi:glycosyltransferase involved in cell wall biosynthesis